jgi:hypothetical protein
MANGDAPDPQDVYLPPAMPPFGPPRPQVAIGPSATNALATPPGAPDPEKAAAAAFWKQQMERSQEIGQRQQEEYEEKKKTLAPLYAEQLAAGRRLSQTSEQATQQLLANQQQIPPYNPPGDMRADAGAWMMLAAGFGAIIGRHGASYNTAALNSFAGMLNGFNQGSLKAIEQNYETWNTNAKRAEAINRQALLRYKAVIDNARMNWDQKAAMIKATADQYQDNIMSSAAEQKNITTMMEMYDKRDLAGQRMEIARQNLERQKNYQENYKQRMIDRAEISAIGTALRNDEVAEAALNRFEPVATRNGELLRKLVDKVNPTEYTDLNTFYAALRRKGDDADVNNFRAALTSYNTELGKIINTNLQGAGALSNQARSEANDMLLPGSPPNVIVRVTKYFDQEMKYKKDLVAADMKYRQRQLDAYRTTGTTPPAYEPPEPPPLIPPGTETGSSIPADDIELVQ